MANYNHLASAPRLLTIFNDVYDSTTGTLKTSNANGTSDLYDAFGRLRVSEPTTLFDSKQTADNLPLLWDELTSGATNTHSVVNAESVMALDTETAVKKRIGYFDGSLTGSYTPLNGYYFETDQAGTLSVNIAKNGTINKIESADFNIDCLDGNGESGITINPDSTVIFFIAFEWLGVGSAIFGVVVDETFYVAHVFRHSNSETTVYTSTPNLPLRYEVRGATEYSIRQTFQRFNYQPGKSQFILATGVIGGADATEMQAICSSVMSEGGQDPTGITYAINTGRTAQSITTNDQYYAILSFRLKDSHIDKTVNILKGVMQSLSNAGMGYGFIIHDGTPISGNGAFTDNTNTAIEYSVGGTLTTPDGTLSGGFVMSSDYVTARSDDASQVENALRVGIGITGTKTIITLYAFKSTTSNDNALGAINFQELL